MTFMYTDASVSAVPQGRTSLAAVGTAQGSSFKQCAAVVIGGWCSLEVREVTDHQLQLSILGTVLIRMASITLQHRVRAAGHGVTSQILTMPRHMQPNQASK